MKITFRSAIKLPVILGLVFFLQVSPVGAANVSIVGGTNGPACNSGCYFTPSSDTINSGDTVTISVPANDPYAGGLEIHGFPQGIFKVTPGGSMTTDPLTADVSYYGTWPSSGCMKGSGTITVSTPVQPPPSSTGSSSKSNSSASTSTAASSPKSTVPQPAPAASPSPTQPAIVPPKTTSTTSSKPIRTAAATSAPKRPTIKTVAAVSGGGLTVVIVAFIVGWTTILRHRRRISLQPPLPAQSSALPPTQNNGDPLSKGN
jgi:hypothetical protein